MSLFFLTLTACIPTKVSLGDSEPRPRREDTDVHPVDTADTDDTSDTSNTGETGDTADDSGPETGQTGDTAPLVLAVDLVSPAIGSTEGGETVVIHGGPYDETAAVTFGGAGRGRIEAWTSTTLTVLTPASVGEGAVDVVVDTNDGSGTLAAGFTFEEPCRGIAASPSSTTVDHATSSDVTVTLTGCATLLAFNDDMRTYFISGATEYQTGVSWTSVPGTVDGTATATLHWTTRTWGGAETTPIGDVYTATITTESGSVTIEVTTR